MAIGLQLLEALLAGLFCAVVWSIAVGFRPREFAAWVVSGALLAFIALHGPIVLGG